MVKLFLIFIVLFSLLLFTAGEEKIRTAEQEPVIVEQTGMALSDGAEFSEINFRRLWAEACILMWKSLVHTQQFDLPDDQGFYYQTLCKTLYLGYYSIQAPNGGMSSNSKQFIRLLSERYDRGFYIYSLRKLII